MHGQRLIFFDTETDPLVIQGKATLKTVPGLVCMTWQERTKDNRIYGQGILKGEEAARKFLTWAEDDSVVLCAHNTAFDMLVLARALQDFGILDDAAPMLYHLYQGRRVRDTLVRQQLLDIEKGYSMGYDLAGIIKRRLKRDVDGKKGADSWRLRYNELRDVPLDEWPREAVSYAMNDAVWAADLFHLQRTDGRKAQYYSNEDDAVYNEIFQMCADLQLATISSWGVMVDPDWAGAVDAHFAREEEHFAALLKKETIVMYNDDGTPIMEVVEENGVEVERPVQFPIMRPNGSMSRAVQQEIVRRAWESVGFDEVPDRARSGKTKAISCTKDILRELEELGADDPRFELWMRYNRANKMRSTYMDPILDAQEGPLCTRYNVLVGTGRTSSSKPNVQNMPAHASPEERERLAACEGMTALERVAAGQCVAPDIRGCFVPRPGHVFVAADYTALEMATLAQVIRNLRGYVTALGQSINNAEDQHLRVAAALLSTTYEAVTHALKTGECSDSVRRQLAAIMGMETSSLGAVKKAMKQVRQLCKAANYGFAGGSSAATFRVYARGYGLSLTIEQAERAREAWFQAWPEMEWYFDHIKSQRRHRGYVFEQHGPNRMTGGWRRRLCDKFTECANTPFQGLAGCGAKYAGWLIWRACHVDTTSPLYGCNVVFFIHDEYIIEAPVDRAEAAGYELSRLMVKGMRAFCPDIRIEAEFNPEQDIMYDRWRK